MRILFVSLLAAAVLFGGSNAEAVCAAPTGGFSTPAETALPARGADPTARPPRAPEEPANGLANGPATSPPAPRLLEQLGWMWSLLGGGAAVGGALLGLLLQLLQHRRRDHVPRF